MAEKIVLVSGHISSGKSTVARMLNDQFGVLHFRTRELLTRQVASEAQTTRKTLQELGEELDGRTGGEWVRDALGRAIAEHPHARVVVVDAVRIARQVDAIRSTFGNRVVHVHLTASIEELARRFGLLATQRGEASTFAGALESETERNVEELANIADAVINTEWSTEVDVLVRVASFLRLYGSRDTQLVDVLVGGETGSEGKGNIAAILAKEYELLVRVGGPNAGHTVLPESGPAYVHHSLPCGTLTSAAQLLIGPGAVLNVETLMQEIADCGVDVDRLSIDPQAMIINAADIEGESKGLVGRIGSTGQGVGFATARRARRDSDVQLASDVPDLAPFIRPAGEVLDAVLRGGGRVFVEGTQGTGLSLYHGPYPYVTSRDTTASGCLAEVGIPPRLVRKVIMVCRTYPIRVQSPDQSTSGPMSRELTWEEIGRRSGQNPTELRKREMTSTTRRQRRVGEFDWALLRKAAALNGPTDLALTFVDYLSSENLNAVRFDQLTPETIQFVEEVERVAGAPVSLIATGFNRRGVIDRRRW